MKKYTIIIGFNLVFLCLVLFLFLNQNKEKPAALPDTPNITENTVEVTGPMTVSRNDLFSITGKQEFLNISLVKGKYGEDWNPSPFMGRSWTGDFEIILLTEYGEIKQKWKLNDYMGSEIPVFNSYFDLAFDDYNGDGNMDFTIGQYGSSNGNIFKILTLTQDGQIEELRIKDHPTLFISERTGRYSTKLEKINSKSFRVSYYDNSIGKQIEDIYEWKENQFVNQNPDDKKGDN
jgi:hypothetical protein